MTRFIGLPFHLSRNEIVIKTIPSRDKRKSHWLYHRWLTNLQLSNASVCVDNTAKPSTTNCGADRIKADFLFPLSKSGELLSAKVYGKQLETNDNAVRCFANVFAGFVNLNAARWGCRCFANETYCLCVLQICLCIDGSFSQLMTMVFRLIMLECTYFYPFHKCNL